jgi:hypothetical protein
MSEEGGSMKEYFFDEEHARKRKSDKDEISEMQYEPSEEDEATKRSRTTVDIGLAQVPAIVKTFLKMKVEDLEPSPDRKIFVAYRNELAKDVFKGLINHGFLSCPVLNKKNLVHYGFIDFLDFVNFFIGELALQHDLPSPPGNILKNKNVS